MEERIGIYIKKINDCIEKHINNDLKKYGLTMTQGRVLRYLHRNSDREVTQKEIENYLNITHATLSGIISRLEMHGFITVNRSKRSNIVALLEKSYINEDNIVSNQNKLENIVCKGFSKQEIDEFISNLKRVYENLKEGEIDA